MKDKNYKGQCGNCVNSEYYKSSGRDIKIYCSYYKAYYYASDSCNHYRGAYVTTAVCNVLGKHEYQGTLAKIRELRTNVMEKDPNCKKLLDRYDEVGPIIGKRLMDDYSKNKDNSLAKSLFDYYIEPTTKMYDEGNYTGAIEKYSAMQDVLEDCFNLKQVDYTNVSEARLIKYKKEVKNK